MATFRYELNGRPTKNKKYVVYLRITVGGKRKLIKTPVEIARPSDFNAKCKGETWIRGGVLEAKSLNAQLAGILAKAKAKYIELDKSGEVTTVEMAKEMTTDKVSPSFMAFIRERTQMMYDSGSFRNWRKYCGFINKFDSFRKKQRMRDITMADLTVDLLNRFDNFLHKWENEREPGKMLHPNTIEVQFNVLRSLVNRAIEVGYLDASKNPFLVFKYHGVKTVKEKLEEDEMQRIIDLDLEEGSLMWHTKNYFLFSYYCAGIRASDFIQLRWANISETGRLRYQMGKNHKERDMILVDQALHILNYYRKEYTKSTDYIFPLLSNETEYATYITMADKDRMPPELKQKLCEVISAKNALINKYLKKIATAAKIEKTLSMHISRHSFAHIAQESGAVSGAIKEILGHSNLATTERYMGSFNTVKTDETLRSMFQPKAKPDAHDTTMSKEQQARELLKEMTPEQIMSILSSLK